MLESSNRLRIEFKPVFAPDVAAAHHSCALQHSQVLGDCLPSQLRSLGELRNRMRLPVRQLCQQREPGAVAQRGKQSGWLTEESQGKLDRALGKDNPSVTEWREISQLIQKREEEELMRADPEVEQPQDGLHPGNSDSESPYGGDSSAEGLSREELKNVLVNQIWLEIFTLERYLKSLKTEEEKAHEANLLACKLPSGEFLDKLIRYETALEKKKERIIKLLLRLKGK